MPKKKVEFRCRCGHDESYHNFDPYSKFFGCQISWITPYRHTDGSIEPAYDHCPCVEFKPDNLLYLEELSSEHDLL